MHDDDRQDREIEKEIRQESPREIQRNLQREAREREEMLRLQEEERRLAEAQKQAILFKMVQGIYYVLGALEVLFLLRLSLCLFGANPENQVVQVLNALSSPFYTPFSNLFGNFACSSGAIVFDLNLVVAMAIYALLAWLVVRLLRLVWS